MYILHFFNNTIKKVIHEESTHVFNRNIMTILLEQFEDKVYTFDDISTIIVNDYRRTTIEDIPNNLKKIEILSSPDLNELPQFPVSIETIIINTSSINLLSENFTKYPNLKELKLGVLSNINSTYPSTLIFKHIKVGVWKNRPIRVPRHGYGGGDDIEIHNQTRDQIAKQVDGLINNRQSVHISSVNKNICESLLIIDELSAKHTKRKNPILDLFPTNMNAKNAVAKKPDNTLSIQKLYDFINIFTGKPKPKPIPIIVVEPEPEQPDEPNLIIKMVNWYSNSTADSRLIKEIMIWNTENTIHSIHKISFSQLFEKIVRIIVNHEQKENLIERLKIELTDSIGYCFTGRVNRMVNSLVGCIDGIKVSFSYKEQILIESQMIIKRLVDKKITFEKAQEEMKEIFNDDEVRKDPLLVELEAVYIESLADYNEEEIAPYNPDILLEETV